MGKTKKKVTETLSKNEKALLSCLREILKEDIEVYKGIYEEHIEKSILVYMEYENIVMEQFTDKLIFETNNVLTLKVFESSSQLQEFTDMFQLMTGLREDLQREAKEAIAELEEEIKENTRLNIVETMKQVTEKSNSTPRVLAIFESELIKKKNNSAKCMLSGATDVIREHIATETQSRINDLIELGNDSLKQVNEHLSKIKFVDTDISKVELRRLDTTKNGVINGREVECNSLGFFMQRRMASNANMDDIREAEDKLRKTMCGNNIIKNEGVILEDGKKLIWKDNGFKVDTTTVTDRSYSYKELNNLAEGLGYKLDRCKGDHAVYIKKDAENIIIPQGRVIGKGLQLKILKDLRVI